MGSMIGQAPKARDVIARSSGPGLLATKNPSAESAKSLSENKAAPGIHDLQNQVCRAFGADLPFDYFSTVSACRAASSSLCFSFPTAGYARFRSARVSMTAAATTTRVNHLLSAGTTYQGA